MTVLTASAAAGELPTIVAHRGASAHAPENTLASISLAVEAKTDWIEFDIRATADGQLILQHDETLKRFVGVDVRVADLSFADARKYDVGQGERMPLLSEAIASCGACLPLIEHKAGAAADYLRVLRDLKVEDRVIVQSFDWRFLRELRKLAPELRLGMLGSKELTAVRLDEIRGFKPAVVGWKYSDLNAGNIDALRAAAIQVAVWTVNDPAVAAKFVDLGVDAIITDQPAEMRAALANR